MTTRRRADSIVAPPPAIAVAATSGGAGPIIARSRTLFEAGDYKLAQELLNKLVYAEPQNREAKDLLADTFEQIGYQQESPSVRNSFLAAAFELRNGIPTGASPKSSGPDIIRAMTTELWLDFLGIRLDSKAAGGRVDEGWEPLVRVPGPRARTRRGLYADRR